MCYGVAAFGIVAKGPKNCSFMFLITSTNMLVNPKLSHTPPCPRSFYGLSTWKLKLHMIMKRRD